MKATAIDQLVDKYNAQVSMPSPVIVEH
jgi:hypothetical protein